MLYEIKVSIGQDKNGDDEVRYDNGTGDLIVRGSGGTPTIRFILSTPQWKITDITFATLLGTPVNADGTNVFQRQTELPATEVDFYDNLWLHDVGTTNRYKYTLTCKNNGSTATSDPEIQNQREPKLGGS